MVSRPSKRTLSDRPAAPSGRLNGWIRTVGCWIDPEQDDFVVTQHDRRVDWLRIVPFILMHVAAFGVIWVGVSPTALAVAVVLYAVRMFAITGFYHRYFAHKAFRTSRVTQFVFAVIAVSAFQRGPLWWASHHRHHHAHADQEGDVHSPVRDGFLWSHVGWFLCPANFRTRYDLVKDWARYPELRFLNRWDILIAVLFAGLLFGAGEAFAAWRPDLGVNGPQLWVWGFVISTLALYHVTFTVNSLAHVWGTRRYATRDASRNNPILALLTLGEGWHNNHHYYPSSARQGFYWWEFDPTYYVLRLMARLRIVWDLKPVPANYRQAALAKRRETR